MGKTHGLVFKPFRQVAPVTFHPENIQLGAGLAVTFTVRPTGSEQPEGHDGLIDPSPAVAVVSVAAAGGHVP